MKQLILRSTQILSLVVLAGLLACKPAGKTLPPDPPGYNLKAGERFNMPERLLEVSGIAFNNYDPFQVYAVQDEEGRLFSQKWGIKKASSVRFAPRGDYEDLAIMNGQVFVIKSNGDIYAFSLNMDKEDISDEVKLWEDLLPKAEYESLYADEKEQTLYVLNKSSGKKKKETLGYKIKYDKDTNELREVLAFDFDVKAIRDMGVKLKSGLRVSALSRNPVTNEWYILSSAEKLLVITKPDWQIKSVHDLDASIFNQPEGLAFDKDQNLYISNEGDEITNGNIIKFSYSKSQK